MINFVTDERKCHVNESNETELHNITLSYCFFLLIKKVVLYEYVICCASSRYYNPSKFLFQMDKMKTTSFFSKTTSTATSSRHPHPHYDTARSRSAIRNATMSRGLACGSDDLRSSTVAAQYHVEMA